ncbi:riboflavin synthase domain-like protein [Xylona heveae TC161]|uniref:NADPH-dependent diflavin oxidoreductase 1 n=1 Tax=Xylona heveae (strain CBS 132557 / TC161) TaxID=1328760 RepID=A0A165GZX7_XYLHT|nr:riboflavin synthase domain-like protein [Xylona heveae TC161]KZF22812.1 riboflavin synthase domain-like protein [Xylona heveae TC161]
MHSPTLTQNESLHERTCLICYGSESGNAQELAGDLGHLAERLHFVTRVAEMNAVELADLSRFSLVILVISTTGQGDLPANARAFWKSLLRKRLPADYLQHVKFTSFGLGDSSYPKFNWAVRKLHKRFLQLGANEIYPRGEADERHPEGLDGCILPWAIDLKKHLLERYPLPKGVHSIPDDVLLQPKWTLEFVNLPEGGKASEIEPNIKPAAQPAEPIETNRLPDPAILPIPNTLTATLSRNERVTPSNHWQDVRHLTLTTSAKLDYLPGDLLMLFPKNFPEDVEQLLELMGWTSHADEPIKFVPTYPSQNTQAYPPPPVSNLLPYPQLTLRSLLTHYLDITSIPRRSFFALAAHFTKDTMQKERLQEFANPEFTDELYDYTSRPRRSILEVLQEMDTVKITWRWIANVIPPIRGRQFSIASGGNLKRCPNGNAKFELLVAIVKYKTVIKRIRQGVCTRYLSQLPEGTQLNILLQRGGLNMSASEMQKPVIMIGPGTGVAPMRSLIWERYALAEEKQSPVKRDAGESSESESSSPVGENALFYGCRNREADFFFEKEWDDIGSKMNLEVHAAFSRDQRGKIYVQDLVRKQSELVYRLLHEALGIIYICGSSGKMPQAVREALIEVFQKEGKSDRQNAENYLLNMEKQGRYKQETW